MLTVLLLILGLCCYHLAKQAWRRWHEQVWYREVPAVVTGWERYTDRTDESSPVTFLHESGRHTWRTWYYITLEAQGQTYTLETQRLFGAFYREGKRTRLYLPDEADLRPLLPPERIGLRQFLAAVLGCAACAGGMIAMCVMVLTK